MDVEQSSESGYISDDVNLESDQYHDSDTGEDIPDPNMEKESLYQEPDKLLVGLQKSHFQSGLKNDTYQRKAKTNAGNDH